MKIVTCLKEVPGKETRFEVSSDGAWIDESRVTFEANECDEYALEEALKLKEAHGGEVVLLTIGTARAEKVMRKGLAMGADRGILVEDPERRLNSPGAFAAALAAVLKEEDCDLVVAGTQSDDYSYAQTGVMLAEMLGVPHATIVMEIEAQPEDRSIKALREMESGWFQWVKMPLPAVLTIQAGSSPVRFASLPGIMKAKKKEIKQVALESLGIDLERLPRLDIKRLYFPEETSRAEMLEGPAEEVAEQLVEKLTKEARVL